MLRNSKKFELNASNRCSISLLYEKIKKSLYVKIKIRIPNFAVAETIQKLRLKLGNQITTKLFILQIFATIFSLFKLYTQNSVQKQQGKSEFSFMQSKV